MNMMTWQVTEGVLIPFLGTALGAACVFFQKQTLNDAAQRGLTGFAAGVMTAASVWSLLIPAMEQSEGLGRWAFLPATAGFWVGVLFLLWLDRLLPRLYRRYRSAEERDGPRRSDMLVLAVVLHNVPEGMAVGVAFAGWLSGKPGLTLAAAVALALGIAIQNLPEGAIISMPLCAEGMGRGRAFFCGVLSGAVEPVAAVLTLLATGLVAPLLPGFLSFAAGAMVHVAAAELIPEAFRGGASRAGALCFALGFTAMMAMDVALG